MADNNIVSFKREELISIKHAYAITIHKAQGSEFNRTYLILPKKNTANATIAIKY